MWSARAERKAFKPAAETIEVESMSAGFLVVAAMAALGGLGARWLARRALSAGESLIEDRLAQTRGLTVALGIALALATPLVVLLLGGVQSMLADPLFFFSPWTAIAALAIGPAMLAGYHPLRAHALGDRWSCFAYVSWTLRFALVLGGPWILLFLGPSMTHVAADGAFVTASGLLVGLGLWARFFVVSTEWLLDGRPLAEDDAARAQIIRRAGIPDLRVVGTAPDDATWTTVLSLPIGPSPSLFVSRSFLEKLGRRGLQGVLAREAARIRHVRRTSWLGPVVPALIVGASVVEPLIARLDPGLAEAYRWIWVGGFIAVPLLVGARQLRIERDLDRRAVPGRGLSPMEKARLRRVATARLLKDVVCPISRERFRPGESAVRLPCACSRVVFKERAILRWLDEHRSCPVCRVEF